MKLKSNSNTSVDIKSRPILNENGSVLNDYELAKVATKYVDDYAKSTGAIAPLDPKFVQWLRDGVKYVDEGKGTFVDYKNNSVYKEIGQMGYDAVVNKTNAMNDKLEKQGAFKPQIVKGGN